MSNKISPRQKSGNAKREAPKRRSVVIQDVSNRTGAGAHRPNRDRRANNPKRINWDSWND